MSQQAKYYIYRNLHKGGFSVRYKGKVIEVLDNITAYNAEFRVSEKGRQRAIEQKVRNVHAYVVAESYRPLEPDSNNLREVYYNPFKVDSFVSGEDKVTDADVVYFTNGKAFIAEFSL